MSRRDISERQVNGLDELEHARDALGGFTRRILLRNGAVVGGGLLLGGFTATGNAAGFSGSIDGGCVTVCHTAFGITVCGTVCLDDFGIHDAAEMTPSGHNVTVSGHLIGPPGAVAKVRTKVGQESTGAVAEGKTTVHLGSADGSDGTEEGLVTGQWTIHATMHGPTRFEASAASAEAWLHFPGSSIRDSDVADDAVFHWTNDGLTISER